VKPRKGLDPRKGSIKFSEFSHEPRASPVEPFAPLAAFPVRIRLGFGIALPVGREVIGTMKYIE
jgi:hypothetical protein